MAKQIIFNPEEFKLLKKISLFAKKEHAKLFLVGGIIRDKLLGRVKVNPDFDFCIKKGAINFGRKISAYLKCAFVVLDKEHGACRVIYKEAGKFYTLDFTDFRGKTLQEDLKLRDFTINSLAVGLEEVINNKGTVLKPVDLYGGIKDLQKKIIRIPSLKAFEDDPLRILRAFAFSALLKFSIEPHTVKLIVAKKKKIATVSFERIRDEFFKILDSALAFGTISYMDKLKVLEEIIPEVNLMRGLYQGPYHHLDIWKHTLESVKQFERLCHSLKKNQEICAYLNQSLSANRRRYALIKLGLLLHDIGKPSALRWQKKRITFHGHERKGIPYTQTICERLKLSNEETRALKRMVMWHLRPGYLGDLDQVSNRAVFRYFRDTQEEALSVLLLSIADQRATCGRLSTPRDRMRHERMAFKLIKEYFKRKQEDKPLRLVNGNDLMKELKLAPSPLIGDILARLEELQAIGAIKTKSEGLMRARKFLKTKPKGLSKLKKP